MIKRTGRRAFRSFLQIKTSVGKRYIAVAKDGAYTFNSLGLKLTNVTLRTSKAGVFYKAEMDCSEALQAEIAYHGVALSAEDQKNAKAFYETWAESMASWNLENLAAAVAPEA